MDARHWIRMTGQARKASGGSQGGQLRYSISLQGHALVCLVIQSAINRDVRDERIP